ncbi:MAG: HEAT repeat domain-containing protein [Verrucomicrobia bacterium]|nr:HEAT repeat domain-containing protein [Verrucomicrobiota bacterium]
MKFKTILPAFFLCAAALAAYAGAEQTVSDLLPKLAAEKVEDRYRAQIELQNLALNAARPGAEAGRAELAGILAAKATDSAVPQPARVWLVRQLEHIGAAESVVALTALLNDPDAELKECARRALEKNPAPAATESLRAALKQGGDTAWVIGLIQSLGERRDPGAVPLLKPLLSGKETALAASSALGKIADPTAVVALWEAYGAGTSGVADALVSAGNRLASTGDKTAARDLFSRLYLAGISPAGATAPASKLPVAPVQVRSAALIGLATANPISAQPLIQEALLQTQPELQLAAVTAAKVAYGQAGVSDALAPLLPKLPASARVYALRVLEAPQEAQVIAAAGDPDESVRLAALERLGQIGTAAAIPILFQAALRGQAGPQKTAVAALATISNPDAGAAITKLAGTGDARSRTVAINALGTRNDPSAAPALLQYAGEPDPEVSAAACAALAKLGTDNELDGLIRLLLAGKNPCAGAALQAVASRAADKPAAAQKLIAQTKTTELHQLAPLFDILAILGGKDALIAISSAAASGNDEVKDAAIRALANWPDFLAARSLLVVAYDPNAKRVHSLLAIQGVARLVKSSDKEPATARVDAALAAMKAATRDEEKKLLLSALASVRDKKAAEAIKHYLVVPQYQKEAGLAAMNLAETLRGPNRPIAKDLAQAVKDAAISDDLTRRADTVLKRN